jgi:hypothetical protein
MVLVHTERERVLVTIVEEHIRHVAGRSTKTRKRQERHKMFDALKFLRDYNIKHSQEGKHARPGWVQLHCPFCAGSQDWHLGINITWEYGNCYRCGWKSLSNIIQKVLQCNTASALQVLNKYLGRNSRLLASSLPKGALACTASEVSVPLGTSAMSERHKRYLHDRRFDPELLEQEWGLLGTGPVGEYRFRIIAPITFNGRLVSYQGRDITGKSSLKYMACKLALEVVHHKDMLYGMDVVPGRKVVVVEGITDVWRLGPGAVATFGTSFLPTQVKLLIDRYDEFYTLFDAEPAAQDAARKLAFQIASSGKPVKNLSLKSGDPGGLSQEEADEIMRERGFE